MLGFVKKAFIAMNTLIYVYLQAVPLSLLEHPDGAISIHSEDLAVASLRDNWSICWIVDF